MTQLSRQYLEGDTVKLAEDLIGACLCIKTGSGVQKYMITETEAYDGPKDKACHASKGRTPRTEIMFGEAGHWYVYLIYGMYHMLNLVTGEADYPAAVLLRGIEEHYGPGKLTKALGIDMEFNGKDALSRSTELWIEPRVEKIPKSRIQKTPRIGVEYSGEWAKKLYRFVLV